MDKRYMTLHTEGNKVKNENGEEVRLLGVNRAGLEWSAIDDHILDSIAAACDQWNSNIIRLPLSQDRWFGYGPEQQDNDSDGEKYRLLVDKIVKELYKREKYVILDLHWNNCGEWSKYIGQHRMPDMNSVIFWKDLANRYKNHPAVLFGLYNEPMLVSWEVWLNGGTVEEEYKDREGNTTILSYEAPGFQALIDAIRELGAKNVAVIGGLDWGYTLDGVVKGYEIVDHSGNGIILDSHIYPWKSRWDELVTVASQKYPILIGECGHYGNTAKVREGTQSHPCEVWVPMLLDWIDEHNYHMTAWDFHPTAGPCLIKSFNNEPTEFWGAYLKEYLAKK